MVDRTVKLSESERRIRTYLVVIAFILFSIFLIGLFWLITTPTETVSLSLSYAAGLSMIVLPCTLPLVFVIVPLSMGKGYKKGFLMALLFGLGLTITITLYGMAVALVGKFAGLDRVTMFMFLIAGIAAFIFGLSELKLIHFGMPAYRRMPSFIQRRGDYIKALVLGLFLGNAGIGCPNPTFYILLTYIASVGSVFTGAFLGVIHGIGRATPLIFLSIAGILGIDVTKSLVKRRLVIEKVLGWGLVLIGAFLIINGLPGGHEWYEQTFVHEGWNRFLMMIGGERFAELMHEEEMHEITGIGMYSPWIMLMLILIPIVWYYRKVKTKKL